MRRDLLAILGVVLLGCTGNVGTITVEVIQAPGSTLLADVVTARLGLTNTDEVEEATRDGDGALVLSLEVATKDVAAVTFEGLDAAGTLIARGQTPPIPLAPLTATVRLFAAPPGSFVQAPQSFDSGRSGVAGVDLNFGAVLAGGVGDDGVPVRDLLVYNTFDHQFQIGDPLPTARSQLAAAAAGDLVYLFGGLDDSGGATSSGWVFNTGVAPAGLYTALAASATIARTGVDMTPLDGQGFLITGSPLVELDAILLSALPIGDAPDIDGRADTLSIGGVAHVLVAGEHAGSTGATLLVGDQFSELAGAPADILRRDHRVVAAASQLVVVGGGNDGGLLSSLIAYDPRTGAFTTTDNALRTPRRAFAVAATRRHLVVMGGIDDNGDTVADAEVFDASTLAPVTVLPLFIPRSGATAVALDSEQILLAGGVDSSGTAIAELELYTP